jgi:hypothetical protein
LEAKTRQQLGHWRFQLARDPVGHLDLEAARCYQATSLEELRPPCFALVVEVTAPPLLAVTQQLPLALVRLAMLERAQAKFLDVATVRRHQGMGLQ